MPKKIKTPNSPQSLLQSHFIIIASLIILLDKSSLTDAVKAHCRTGFKVLEIMYLDRVYKTGRGSLFKKEFDTFFKCAPSAHYNSRELISTDMVIDNIRACISSNVVILVAYK